MKYTPGPWNYRESLASGNNFIYAGGKKEAIAGVLRYVSEDGGTEGDANARLIAAAPELLAAAHKIVESLEELAHVQCGDRNIAHTWDFVKIADEAIAKAEGM